MARLVLSWKRLKDEGRQPEWFQKVRAKSGVYVIRDRHSEEILYVGQSSKGRLGKTLLRHFQSWKRSRPYQGTMETGPVYNRKDSEVAIIVTRDDRAMETESELMERLAPRDNRYDTEFPY